MNVSALQVLLLEVAEEHARRRAELARELEVYRKTARQLVGIAILSLDEARLIAKASYESGREDSAREALRAVNTLAAMGPS